MEVNGIPLHPLVVHAAVVLVPLAVVLAAAHVLVPGARWVMRWVALAGSAAALAAVVLARQTGEDLQESTSNTSPLIALHEQRSWVLLWAVAALTALVALAWRLLPAPSPLRSGRYGAAGRPSAALRLALTLAVLAVGVVVLVWVVLTGEAGARSVWENRLSSS